MKNEIITLAFIGLLATASTTTLNAECIDQGLSSADFRNCLERESRAAMSYEEGKVYDLEKENRLERRQRDAEAEKKRLEQEKKDAEYEKKSTLEKAKSWFN